MALLIIFGPNCYDDPMRALTRLKKSGLVEEYNNQFEKLSNRLRALSDQLSCFLSRLKNENTPIENVSLSLPFNNL